MYYRAPQGDRVLAGIPSEEVDELIRTQIAAQSRPGGETRPAFMDYVDYLSRHLESAAAEVKKERSSNLSTLRTSRGVAGTMVVMLAADLVAMYYTYKSPLPYFHSNFNNLKLAEDGGLLVLGYGLGVSALETRRRRVTDRVQKRRLRAISKERAESAAELDRILRPTELSVELRQSGHFIGDDLDLRTFTTGFCDRHESTMTARSNPIRRLLGPRPKSSGAELRESDLWARDRWDDGATLLVASARLGLIRNDSVRVVAQGVAKDLGRGSRSPLARGQALR